MKGHVFSITDGLYSALGRCSCGAEWSVPLGVRCRALLHEKHEKHVAALEAVTDPMLKAIRKARKGNPVDVLDKLLEEQAFWQRRETIARTKLAKVRARLVRFAQDRAKVTLNNPVLGL